MMIQKTTFKTSISLAAKAKAEQFRRLQLHCDKKKQVYLNTLATSVVNYYLNSLGWITDLEGSDSWNPILQTMMDIADLKLPNYGAIECRVVLPNENYVFIPPEVWGSRIAYVVVRLNESLTEAEILGFVRQIKQSEITGRSAFQGDLESGILQADSGSANLPLETTPTQLPLEQLESLTQLTAYLRLQKRSSGKTIHLSRWLQGIAESDWLELENSSSSMVVNYRGLSHQNTTEIENLSSGVCRTKLIELEDPLKHNINLIVNVAPKEVNNFSISVKVCPTSNSIYLPQGLELVILDETQKPIMCAQANDTETIEFCFSGELGEHFGLEASLDNYIKMETFII